MTVCIYGGGVFRRMAFWRRGSPHSLRRRSNICGAGQLETPQYTSALQGAHSGIARHTRNATKFINKPLFFSWISFFIFDDFLLLRFLTELQLLWCHDTANTSTMTTMTMWQGRVSTHRVHPVLKPCRHYIATAWQEANHFL